jgi:hypothetical protein
MLVAMRTNLLILTSYSTFPNNNGLEKVKKLMLKKKLVSEEVFNFQDTQEEDVQVVAPFAPKKK